MPESNAQQPPSASPFEIVSPGKSKKGGNKNLIVIILVVVFLILSVVAGVLLVRQNQNVQEKAAISNVCPGAEKCPYPGDPARLWSCHPADSDGTVDEQLCGPGRLNTKSVCGTKTFCCPPGGGNWTTDLTKCTTTASPTPTGTPSPTPTNTPTPSPTGATGSTPTATPAKTPTPVPTLSTKTPTPAAQTTSLPIPVTGTDWPTYLGAGVGVVVIVASILIAL